MPTHTHARARTHTAICNKRDTRDIGSLMFGTDFQYSD